MRRFGLYTALVLAAGLLYYNLSQAKWLGDEVFSLDGISGRSGLRSPATMVAETPDYWRYSAQGSIRVRIFPHFKNYRPHGRDRDVASVVLEVEQPGFCQVFRARPDGRGPDGPVLFAAHELQLHAVNLQDPVWIRCSEPPLLRRAPGLPSYRYEGEFFAVSQTTRGGRQYLLVVNALEVEAYLRGVVPAEVFPFWPEAALKTQAIAARTYAAFHRLQARQAEERLFDVDDTIAFQSYTGTSDHDPRTDAAIAATAGVILRHGYRPIEAYYHADSGGHLESAYDVWGVRGAPYTRAQAEVLGQRIIQSPSWEVVLTRERLEAALRRQGLLQPVDDTVAALLVAEAGRTPGGRVRELIVSTTAGESLALSIHQFRRMVNLPSSLFEVEVQGDGWQLVGRGSGHGVGLSQRGAMALAQYRQWDYQRILSFYYPGAELCRGEQGSDDLYPSCFDAAEASLQELPPQEGAPS